MTDPGLLRALLRDLAAEGDVLAGMLRALDDAQWSLPTPSPGWDVAHQVAHLAWTDEVALLAATDKAAWYEVVLLALDNPSGFVDDAAAKGATLSPQALLERWEDSREQLARTLEAAPQDEKLPWFGPPMSPSSMATARLMETWAHARDVADALGVLVEPTERLQHVAHLGVRTRDFAFSTRGLPAPREPFYVELVSPEGRTWTWGPRDAAQSVRGTAYDFCLLVTQRRHRSDLGLVAKGTDAHRWLDIAQCFAGPPGVGRSRRAPG